MADEQIDVVRAARRYEVHVDGKLAGYTMFHPDAEGRLVFPHTVVDPDFGGRGLGKVLVSHAMADVSSRGETVVPLCPYLAKYLRGHEVPGLKIDWPDGAP